MALDRTWYNALIDDDGSNTVGTVWGKDDIKNLLDSVDVEIARLSGGRLAYTPAFYTAEGVPISGGSRAGWYVMSGDLVLWSVYNVNLNVPAITGYLQMTLPPKVPILDSIETVALRLYVPTIGDKMGFGSHRSTGYLDVVNPGGNFPAGAGHVMAQGFYFWR
jgi:hypothetical protein